MANSSTFCLLFFALLIGCASSARILVDDSAPVDPSFLVSPPGASDPSQTGPADVAATPPAIGDSSADSPLPDSADVAAPVVAPDAPVAQVDPPVPDMAVSGASTSAAGAATSAGEPQLSFYMHDIIGGSHPSARVVTGIITSTEVNVVPFSKPTNILFPFNGGVPLLNGNNFNGANLNGIINNDNLPYITGFNGAQVSTVIQNNGNANQVTGGNNQPFVTAGQLPAGATLQQLLFGTITVVDDQLTEGHELGTGVMGKAQGFYMASSLDGTSQTMALTLFFHGKDTTSSSHDEVEDTISLFGVHRTASLESQVAIVGGTGKYGHAKGYATVETLPRVDQHTTDGVDTILHFSIYFSE